MLEVTAHENGLTINMSADYLKNSVECAFMTGGEKTVSDTKEMLAHFAAAVASSNDDSHFHCCIDRIADDAYEAGEGWLTLDSESDLYR